jgi:hypothetical protein
VAPAVQEARQKSTMFDPRSSIFDTVTRHKNLVLCSPFILAALLMVWYTFGGSDIRKVLDFFAPGHLFQ